MSRERWDAPAIAKELECSERTVYRDLQTLSTAGVPWFFDERRNCYRVRDGFYFPALAPPTEESSDHLQGDGRQSPTEVSPLQLARQSLAAARRLMADAGELVSMLDRLEAVLAGSSGQADGAPHPTTQTE